jgi:hypothetical protein
VVKTKRKVYDSEAEFEADRKKMCAKGWVVLERRFVPVSRPSWSALHTDSLAALIFLSPLLLVGWLLYRKAPAEEIVVTYGRRGG